MTSRVRLGAGRQDILVLLLVPLIFFLSANFFFQFYRYIFNSDSAFNLILAKAVLDEGTPFPKDVWFSHDVYLLRPDLVIAFFRLLGLRGLFLYAIACSTIITGCFYAVYFAFRWLLRLPALHALVIAVVVFVPLGREEYEYVLGQQSHILQVTLSLIGFLGCIALTQGFSRLALGVIPLCTFLLCWDSPLRGCLFGIGVFAILAPSAIRAMRIRYAAIGLVGAAILGSLANAWVKSAISILGVSYYLTIPSTSLAFARLGEQVEQYFSLFLGVDDLSGLPLSFLSSIMLATKFTLALSFIGIACYLTTKVIRCLATGEPVPPSAQLAFAGVVTIAAGCLVVSFSGLILGVRHYFLGLTAIKAASVLLLCEMRCRFAHVLRALAVPCVIVGSSITPTFLLTQTPGYYDHMGESVALTRAIGAIIKDRHWPLPIILYGTYWNSSDLEVFLDDKVLAAPISVENNTIRILKWMSRPSRYCQAVPSLLLVRTDQPVLHAIAAGHGATAIWASRFHEIFLMTPDLIEDCRSGAKLREPIGNIE